MRACAAATEIYLIKKTMIDAETLSSKFKLQRIEGGEVKFGGGSSSWIRRDGEQCEDEPDYVWIVAKRLP